jgi:hypothetical protein
MEKYRDIVQKSLSKFEQSTGLKVTLIEHSDVHTDFSVEIATGSTMNVFDIEAKPTINAAVIGHIKQKIDLFQNPPLLITSYITPAMYDLLKSSNINAIDAAGNALIITSFLIIQLRGCKPEEPLSSVSRMFRPSGLKLLFALLCKPGLESSDYREIASEANVSLGSVGWIIRDLKQSGYLVTLGNKKMKLLKKEELVKKWVFNYHDQLKPKLFLGHYSSLLDNWFEKSGNFQNCFLGSEPAASIMTGYLKPDLLTIYVDELQNDFLIKNKLHKTKDGKIVIFKKFWRFIDQWSEKNVVPPLLVYADLIGSQSDRNIETAKIIYDKELSKLTE